jgi:hypothetical protein
MAISIPKRRRLGGTRFGSWMLIAGSSGIRSVVFDLGDRLEIEERDHWNIVRRRIPLREVVLVTKHSFKRLGNIIAMGIIAVLVGILSVVLSAKSPEPMTGLIVFLILGAPFLAFAMWFLLVSVTEIQIQSRRVTARLRFGIGKATGNRLYEELLGRIRQAQRSAPSAEPAAAPPDIPIVEPAG